MRTSHRVGLNPAQELAVLKIDGPMLVLAGAGTGKTRVVTSRIAEILSNGHNPARVCAVTFTNKAAREMRERVAKVLSGADMGGMVVSTFHSLGLRILREFGEKAGFPSGATIADSADQAEIVADALRTAGVRRDVLHPKVAHFKISLWKNAAKTPEQVLEEAADAIEGKLALTYRSYEDELRRRQLVDFDDLIFKPLELLHAHRDILAKLQDRWHFLLVDEYQDTNGCQYRMLRQLAAARRNLCVVGDDDQSIYGWRGAEPGRILNFQKDFPGAEVVTLEQNYRSTQRILSAANDLIGKNLVRRPKKLWSAAGDGDTVKVYAAEDEKDELDFVTSRMMLLRTKEEFRHQDFAVLFRANSQCRPLEQVLRQRKIPYRVVGTRSFFDRREVRDLLSFVKLAKNTADDGSFLRVINVPARGVGRGALEKITGLAANDRTSLLDALTSHHASALTAAASAGAKTFLSALEGLRTDAATRGIGRALEALVLKIQYRDHLRMVIEDPLELQARLTVVDELIETAQSVAGGMGTEGLSAFLDALALQETETEEDQDENKSAVTLLTMHAAKGLEYPVVFIVGVEEGLLPHGKVVAEDDDEDAPPKSQDPVEEERRLFYVGITRARRKLFLTYAKKRTRMGRETPREPSRFLEEIGEAHLESLTAASEAPTTPDGGKAWLAAIRAQWKKSGQDEAEGSS